jgi:hypothetical protein
MEPKWNISGMSMEFWWGYMWRQYFFNKVLVSNSARHTSCISWYVCLLIGQFIVDMLICLIWTKLKLSSLALIYIDIVEVLRICVISMMFGWAITKPLINLKWDVGWFKAKYLGGFLAKLMCCIRWAIVTKKVGTFSCYDNVDELVDLYVCCFRHMNGLCMFIFQ